MQDNSSEYLSCEGSQRLLVWLANRISPPSATLPQEKGVRRSHIPTIPESVKIAELKRLGRWPLPERRTDGSKEAYVEHLAHEIIPSELKQLCFNPIDITTERVSGLIESVIVRGWVEWNEGASGYCLKRTALGDAAWMSPPPPATVCSTTGAVEVLLYLLKRAMYEPRIKGDPRLMGIAVKVRVIDEWLSHFGVAPCASRDAFQSVIRDQLAIQNSSNYYDRLIGRLDSGFLSITIPGEIAAGAGRDWEKVRARMYAPLTQPTYLFRRQGDLWEIRFENEQGHLGDLKGLGIIYRLLQEPNSPLAINALDLCDAGSLTGTRLSFQQVFDSTARESIQTHIKTLERQIDDEVDPDKLSELKKQQTELAAELTNSQGLGGKPRRLGPNTLDEKARQSVRRVIDRALEKIDEHLPRLAEHLRASIKTEGSAYAYRPNRECPWSFH